MLFRSDEEKIKAKVKELNLEDNVSFLGIRKDIKELMQTMDVFVFPSLFEGLPLVLVETQANGIDIYASKEGISQSAKMCGNFEFISLDKPALEWAKIILSKKHTRSNNDESIKQSGYDIREESKKLEKEFIQLISK